MMFGKIVAVYCENHKEHMDTVRNTLRLRYRDQPVNAVCGNSRCLLWEPYATHRYMPYLTGNTLRARYRGQPVNVSLRKPAVYCENHTEHTDIVYTSQETHYISATDPNRLLCWGQQSLFVWKLYGTQKYSSYFTGNTLFLRHRDQSVNTV
jgi:hypothetical protein